MSKLKYISWNVNGLRACIKKGFMDAFHDLDADCFCLQETKLQPDQIELDLPGYHQYWNSAVKKGYSGTAIFSKKEPLSVTYGLGSRNMIRKGVSSLPISDRIISSAATRQTASADLSVWTTA